MKYGWPNFFHRIFRDDINFRSCININSDHENFGHIGDPTILEIQHTLHDVTQEIQNIRCVKVAQDDHIFAKHKFLRHEYKKSCRI